jgi:hypothetical protein
MLRFREVYWPDMGTNVPICGLFANLLQVENAKGTPFLTDYTGPLFL